MDQVKEFEGYEIYLGGYGDGGDAEYYCEEKLGGYLASIRSAEENDFLAQHVYTGIHIPRADWGQVVDKLTLTNTNDKTIVDLVLF